MVLPRNIAVVRLPTVEPEFLGAPCVFPPSSGINVRKGTISDMYAEHVIQPVLVNSSALKLATECVGMILKIDDVVAVM